jgi:hypothetical protein
LVFNASGDNLKMFVASCWFRQQAAPSSGSLCAPTLVGVGVSVGTGVGVVVGTGVGTITAPHALQQTNTITAAMEMTMSNPGRFM